MKKRELETERLILKPADLDDAAFFLKLYNEPQFINNIGDRNLRSLEDAKAYIEFKMISQFKKSGYGNYVIIRKTDNEKVGAVGIFIRDGFQIADIGFSLLKEFHSLGYAFEAADCLKNYVRENFNLNKISAMTSTDNTASQNLIEKLGLSYVKMVEFPDDGELLRYYEN